MQLCCLRGTLCLLVLVTCSRDQGSAATQSQFHTSSFLHPHTMQVCAIPGTQCSIGYHYVPSSLSSLICDLLRRKDTVPWLRGGCQEPPTCEQRKQAGARCQAGGRLAPATGPKFSGCTAACGTAGVTAGHGAVAIAKPLRNARIKSERGGEEGQTIKVITLCWFCSLLPSST